MWNSAHGLLFLYHLENAYELLYLRAIKMSMLYKNHIFQCMGKIFVWNSKGALGIPRKISYPHMESCGIYSQVII